jgi:hypothetical protein
MLFTEDHDVIETSRRMDPMTLSASPFAKVIEPRSGDRVCPWRQ